MPYHPARARQLSNSVGRIPFGFATLDSRFDGALSRRRQVVYDTRVTETRFEVASARNV